MLLAEPPWYDTMAGSRTLAWHDQLGTTSPFCLFQGGFKTFQDGRAILNGPIELAGHQFGVWHELAGYEVPSKRERLNVARRAPLV